MIFWILFLYSCVVIYGFLQKLSCFSLSSVDLVHFFLNMSVQQSKCLCPHVKNRPRLSYRNVSSPCLTQTKIYAHADPLAQTHKRRCAHRQTQMQTVSCALPTDRSTKTEHTASPCLTHIYTHTHICTHKLCNSPLHTLKGTRHKIKPRRQAKTCKVEMFEFKMSSPKLDVISVWW